MKAAVGIIRASAAVWVEGMQMLIRAALGKNQ